MKTVTIHDIENYRVDSIGNGLCYLLVSKHAKQSIYFQGDDAAIFSNQLTDMENTFPDLEYNEILRRIWNDYCECAEDEETI